MPRQLCVGNGTLLVGFDENLNIRDMFEIQHRYGNVLERLITEKLEITDFRRAFVPGQRTIKAVICFK